MRVAAARPDRIQLRSRSRSARIRPRCRCSTWSRKKSSAGSRPPTPGWCSSASKSIPTYKNILDEALLAVARAKGHASIKDAGFHDIRGFMFVSSPKSTTPFHIDSEDNVFVQMHGEKYFTVFDNRTARSPPRTDRALHHPASQPEVRSRVRAQAMCNRLLPGDGVFVPYLGRTGSDQRQLFDLARDHLEDQGGHPQQRPLPGQRHAA